MAKKASKKLSKKTTKKAAAKPTAGKPAAKTSAKSAAKAKKPAAKVAARPSKKIAAKPAAKVAKKPATTAGRKPAAKPATKPAAKLAPAQNAPAHPEFVVHEAPTMPASPSSTPARNATKASDALPADEELAFAIEAARLVRDDNCDDVVVLDVRKTSHVSDYIVIGSGTSDRQMRSVLEHVEKLGESRGFRAFRSSRDDRATWLLLDFVDVVVHLFEPSTRSHYDLEMLWGDSPRIEWERADQQKRDRAGIA